MQSLHDYAFGEEKETPPIAVHGPYFMLVALVESAAIMATALLTIAYVGGLIALHVFLPKKRKEM